MRTGLQPQAEEVEPEEVPEPEPAAAPTPAPAPVVTRPASRLAPSPAPVPQPESTNGTLSVLSNMRVLVKVNGSPVDFTPLKLTVPAGTYTISAALPSRADTEQTQEVTLGSGEETSLHFTF